MLLKVYPEISVSLGQVWNFEILDSAMAKVKKVNITVTKNEVLWIPSLACNTSNTSSMAIGRENHRFEKNN